jgi:membrane associated rhomboid family serine protease
MQLPRGRMTNAIAVATFIAFVAVYFTGWNDAAAVLGGFIPARLSVPELLDQAGLPLAAVPVWLTPLTAALLHGGWLHIGFNLLTFLFCGRQVEQVLGPRLLALLYVVGAYAAAAGQWALDPHGTIPMIGASGAVSAIIGAYALLYSNQDVRAFGPVPSHVVRMLWLGAGWILVQSMVALAGIGAPSGEGLDMGRIAIGAHIGGFVAGMVLTRPMLRWRFRKVPAGLN